MPLSTDEHHNSDLYSKYPAPDILQASRSFLWENCWDTPSVSLHLGACTACSPKHTVLHPDGYQSNDHMEILPLLLTHKAHRTLMRQGHHIVLEVSFISYASQTLRFPTAFTSRWTFPELHRLCPICIINSFKQSNWAMLCLNSNLIQQALNSPCESNPLPYFSSSQFSFAFRPGTLHSFLHSYSIQYLVKKHSFLTIILSANRSNKANVNTGAVN